MSAVNSAGSSSSAQSSSNGKTGFAALSSNDFLKMLIVQLQNQDPTAPMGNDELLRQLTSMQNLQSNLEMSDAMKSITTNQQLSTAASFIGKTVGGTSSNNELVQGVADKAYLKEGKAYVGIGDVEIPLSQVTKVIH